MVFPLVDTDGTARMAVFSSKKGDGSNFSFYHVGSLQLVGAAVILVALVVLMLATGHRAGEDWNRVLLTAINTVIVSLAAMGGEVTCGIHW